MAGRNGRRTGGRLIPYIRQSRAKERTISISEQQRSIESWAKPEGVDLTEAIIEQGVSGSKPWRERELGRAIEACARGEAAGIVVAYQDRLTRENGLGTAEVWEALARAGARLVVTAEGLDTAKGDQELQFSIKAAIAREQWKRFRENWDNTRRSMIERGVHGCAYTPVGYLKGADGRLVPDPKSAKAVRNAFLMKARGATFSEIGTMLERSGVKPRNGKRWIHKTLVKVLQNRVYLGEARSGDYVKKGAHEPLVTRGEWKAAQAKHPGRITRGTVGARLSGLVYCGSCGHRMTPDIGERRYRCKKNHYADGVCDAPANANMRDLDRLVMQKFVKHWDPKLGPRAIQPDQPDIEPLRRDLENAQGSLDELLDDVESLAALSKSNRLKLLANAQDAVDTAQVKLDAEEAKLVVLPVDIVHIGEYFEEQDPDDPSAGGELTASVPEQRMLLTAGIERITVKRGKEPIAKRAKIVFKPN